MVMTPFYKKPRISLATRLEATFGKMGVKKVYEARKVEPLTPMSRGLSFNTPRMQVKNIRGGWSKVTYRDPSAKNEVTFHIRTKDIKDALAKGRNAWYAPEEKVYSIWIHGSKAGELYSKRRQVEGMYKASVQKGDLEMAGKLEQILAMSDEKVAQFWDAWTDAHSDTEIEDFFKYEEEVDEAWL